MNEVFIKNNKLTGAQKSGWGSQWFESNFTVKMKFEEGGMEGKSNLSQCGTLDDGTKSVIVQGCEEG